MTELSSSTRHGDPGNPARACRRLCAVSPWSPVRVNAGDANHNKWRSAIGWLFAFQPEKSL
jgi:hypothetical protein